MFDRAYHAASFLLDWQQAAHEHHWLMGVMSSLCYEMVKKLGKGDLQREEVLHSKEA